MLSRLQPGARASATVVAAALFVLVPAGHAAVPAGNLIQNPGGETGGAYTAPPSWTTTGNFVQRPYGSEGAAFSSTIGGGVNFLAGGQNDAVSTAQQVFDISAGAADVDAGRVSAELRGYLGGYLADQDTLQLVAETQGADPARAFTAFLTIGPVTAAERGNQTALLLRTAAGRVPSGTRRLRVTATSTRSPATYNPSGFGVAVNNDGWGDNLSLALTTSAAPGGPATPTGPRFRRRGSVRGIKSPGRRIKGRISVAGSTCKSGRRLSVKKGSKTVGSGRTNASGRFNIKTKKHKKGKLTVKIRRKTTSTTICSAISKRVPGRN